MAYTASMFQGVKTAANSTATAAEAKRLNEEWISTLPFLSLDEIVADETTQYVAIYNVVGCSYIKLKVAADGGTKIVCYAGTQFDSSDYYVKMNDVSPNSLAYVWRAFYSEGFIGFGAATFMLNFGKLTSLKDGSQIEFYSAQGQNPIAVLSASSKEIGTVGVPTLSSMSEGALVPGQSCFCEGVYTFPGINKDKQPYGINGHGPYSVVSTNSLSVYDILESGNDAFAILKTVNPPVVAIRLK